MYNDRTLHSIWLSLALKPANPLAKKVLQTFGSASEIYSAEKTDPRFSDFPPSLAEALQNKDLSKAEKILDFCKENDIFIICAECKDFPKRLKSLDDLPIVLYCKGQFKNTDDIPCISIVGPRKYSQFGNISTKRVCSAIAKTNSVIVSGLAEGIDALAHKNALNYNAYTIAVLGCGIDIIYPYKNKELYKEVEENGLIITEYPPSTPPTGSNFPQRNRLISGLSDAVIVIEAPIKSGSLITADRALKQNRTLFTIPASIFDPSHEGSNNLLSIGAEPLIKPSDIITFINKHKNKSINEAVPVQQKAVEIKTEASNVLITEKKELDKRNDNAVVLTETENLVLSKLSYTPIFPDKISNDNLSISDTLRTLTMLEMKGLVQRCAGGKFTLSKNKSKTKI